jgi:hypothetical protein
LSPSTPVCRRAAAEFWNTTVIYGTETITDHLCVAAPGEGFSVHGIGVLETAEIIGFVASGLDLGANLFGAILPVE